MYSREERLKAIELYIRFDKCVADVIRVLGYPNYRTLKKWYAEYQIESNAGIEHAPCVKKSKYSEEQQKLAVDDYLENGKSISRTVRNLGYPSRPTMRKWIKQYAPDERKTRKNPVQYKQDEKIKTVLIKGTSKSSVKKTAEMLGIERSNLYRWEKELQTDRWDHILMNEVSNDKNELEEEIAKLKKQVKQLRLEKDLLEGAADLIKKGPGVSLATLTNREKSILIDALREKYALSKLFDQLKISHSSYYYQKKTMKRIDKYASVRARIIELFNVNYQSYGYRRIHQSLKDENLTISEKVVRRIMSEECLIVSKKTRRKYTSYVGEVSEAPANLIKRNFKALSPNAKWLTDITEFRIPEGKVYLSPIVDCFDGMLVSWTISTKPDADLVNTMLDNAISSLNVTEKPIIHSDRGGHYRWPGWIDRMTNAGLRRSMSKKGCTPDNSACEGVFGRIKNEMFYDRSWQGVSVNNFIKYLDEYLCWYNTERIKMSLGGMSPVAYRKQHGLYA